MNNNILLRELKNKEKVHEIFHRQTERDLTVLAKVIERDYPEDILLDFDPQEYWMKVSPISWNQANKYLVGDKKDYKLIKQEELKVLDHYVTLKILESLAQRDSELKVFFNKDDLEIFTSGNTEKYEERKDVLYTSEDIKEILKCDENAPSRVHFIMNGIKSNRLCDVISTYLDQDTPFTTRIYLAPNGFYTAQVEHNGKKEYLWAVYDYIDFYDSQEGTQTRPYRKKKGQKKKTSQGE